MLMFLLLDVVAINRLSHFYLPLMMLVVTRKILESTFHDRNTTSKLFVANKRATKSASVYPLLYRLPLFYAPVFVAVANNEALSHPT